MTECKFFGRELNTFERSVDDDFRKVKSELSGWPANDSASQGDDASAYDTYA